MGLTTAARPCERFCQQCQQWLHHSRFRQFTVGRHSPVSTKSRRLCKACEQIERNKKLNDDRALAIIERRAEVRASRLGVSKHFVWVNMNWGALVAMMRALMSPEGRCPNCGHAFLGERDIQIEHHEPPRHDQDWAREHTRNLVLSCASCNRTKASKPFADWLDEQEAARLSNERDPDRSMERPAVVLDADPQLLLFDDN